MKNLLETHYVYYEGKAIEALDIEITYGCHKRMILDMSITRINKEGILEIINDVPETFKFVSRTAKRIRSGCETGIKLEKGTTVHPVNSLKPPDPPIQDIKLGEAVSMGINLNAEGINAKMADAYREIAKTINREQRCMRGKMHE